jgi:outer membrane beta-barrel protein
MRTQNAIILAAVTLWLMPTAFADSATPKKQQQQAPADAASPAPEKVDVSDLENKYWAPKDTDFSVVQNRTFTKEHKLFLSLEFGPDISPTNYVNGNQVGFNANYFLNERYGFQFTYLDSALHPNGSYGTIVGEGGHPDFGIMQNYMGVGFDWVPFYSKMSFLGKKILYFDMAITPTIGFTKYNQQTVNGDDGKEAFTYGIDITQYYFFTDHFAIRADLKNQWYNEDVVKYQGDGITATGQGLHSQSDREMIFLIGFTYYFGLGK